MLILRAVERNSIGNRVDGRLNRPRPSEACGAQQGARRCCSRASVGQRRGNVRMTVRQITPLPPIRRVKKKVSSNRTRNDQLVTRSPGTQRHLRGVAKGRVLPHSARPITSGC